MNPVLLWFHKLGSPPYFYRFAARLQPWLLALTLLKTFVLERRVHYT